MVTRLTSLPGSNTATPLRPAPQRGFTLLEILIALGIATLIAAIALPSLHTSPVAELKSSAQTVAAALRQTRLDAMDDGRTRALLLDTQARTLQGKALARQLPADVGLKLTTAEREMRGRHVGGIRFWPDGSASGGRVILIKDNLRIRVDVEWLTGRIHISEVEDS